jgi:hypothetical protein
MNARTLATVAVAIGTLSRLAYAQSNIEALKPVPVCVVLANPAEFRSQSIAVLGILRLTGGSPEIVANCDTQAEVDGRTPQSSLPLMYSASQPPGGVLTLDHSILVRGIEQMRGQEGGRQTWTVVYGRLESGDEFDSVGGFDPRRSPATQLMVRDLHGLSFDNQGREVTTVIVDNHPGLLEVANPAPIDVTVCDLARAPDKYYARTVRISHGIAYPPGLDSSAVLSDSSCSASLLLDASNGDLANDDTGVRALHEAFRQYRVTEVTVVGKVERVLLIGGGGYLRFILQSVSVISLKYTHDR